MIDYEKNDKIVLKNFVIWGKHRKLEEPKI